MNFLEKALIRKLLDPKNTVSGDGCLSIQLGALKTLPPDFVPLLPLAEKCLGALPGISGVTADAAGGKVTIRYEGGRLTALIPVRNPTPIGSVTFPGSVGTYKLFLLDSQNRPLCEPWSS